MRMTEDEYSNLIRNRKVSTPTPIYREKPKTEKAVLPTEHQEQCEVIRFRDDNIETYPSLKWLHAIPNGQAKTPFQRMKFKREGLTSGVSDLCLPEPRGSFGGLYLELKRRKGGKVSDEQKEFIEFVKNGNYFVRVAEGSDEAIKFLKQYLALPKQVKKAIELADQLF